MILTWAEAFEAGPGVCGGKGYGLARLARYGFRVPPGGVLPAAAYRETMRDPARRDAIQNSAPAELPSAVRSALRNFLDGPELAAAALAVRSSATAEDSARASFAGIHRSVLHVRGAAAAEQAVVQCYSSLWTAQARAYRKKMGFSDDEVDCAVVLCRMVTAPGAAEPVSAGVSFSADPLSGRRDLIAIEAAAGLGENVVGGKVAPQRYVYRRRSHDEVAVEMPRQNPVLTEAQAQELAVTTLRIHWALGEGQDPQDIEWAHDGEHLWILQARPVTRLPRPGPAELRRLPRYWSTANIKDTMPDAPSELSWSGGEAIVADVAFGAAAAAGYHVPPGLELVRRFHGRGYFDVTLMQWVFFDAFGTPPAVTARALGGRFPLLPQPAGDPLKGAAGRRRLKCSLRVLLRLWGFEKRATTYFRQLIATMASEARQEMESSDREMLRTRMQRLRGIEPELCAQVGLANSASGPWLEVLEPLLVRRFGERGRTLTAALCAGSGGVTSAQQGYRVAALAEVARQDPQALDWLSSAAPSITWSELPSGSPFRQALARFLDEFGHRATREGEFLCPRWVEDPEPILDEVRHLLARGSNGLSPEAAIRRRREAEDEIRRRCPLLRPLIFWLAAGLRRGYALRELGKSALVAPALPVRRVALDIGRQLVAEGHLDHPEQVLHLAAPDLASWLEGYWDGGGARELAEDRRARRDAWSKEEPPDTIADDGAALAVETDNSSADGRGWQGVAIAPGRASGAARIVLRPEDGARLLPGEILIAPSTDPGWTPLFVRAAALVTETGGYLSHGAIVAREYGLPAVANIPGLLKQIEDGEPIVVDGNDGTVTRAD